MINQTGCKWCSEKRCGRCVYGVHLTVNDEPCKTCYGKPDNPNFVAKDNFCKVCGRDLRK